MVGSGRENNRGEETGDGEVLDSEEVREQLKGEEGQGEERISSYCSAGLIVVVVAAGEYLVEKGDDWVPLLFGLLCERRCSLRVSDRPKYLPQPGSGHWNGRSPVCILE